MSQLKGKTVVVTTDKDRRGVFFGVLEIHDEEKSIVVLKEARMAVYWSSDTRGVLGLAANGPATGSKITPAIPEIHLNGVSSVMLTTEKAAESWRLEKWS